jgi:hypothetical protein
MAVFRKIIQPDTSLSCVRCPTCSCEIPVLNARRLPPEFSVRCPNCGSRHEHLLAGLHDTKRDAESTQEIHNIQFGRRNGKKNESKDIVVPPKTRLNGLVSWLLQ